MAKKVNRVYGSGATLVELLTVLVMVVVSIALAAPNMSELFQSNTLRTETSRLVSAINLARSKAVLSNAPISMCPSRMMYTGQKRCSDNYADGWIVFRNFDRDREVDNGNDEILQIYGALPKGFTVTNRAGTRYASELITYLPDGTSRRNLTLLVCPPRSPQHRGLGVIMNIVGRPRVAANWGTCPQTG